ncbi:MAG: thiamine pyrophosphate-dependent enzyme [bacterium]|nr:thiamine pyrophosphate-dependent enzyme [bacterium]
MSTNPDQTAIPLKLYKEGTADPQWCPGCGDFAALSVYTEALRDLTNPELFNKPSWEAYRSVKPIDTPDGYCQKTFIGVAPHTIVTDGGIGCMGQFPQYVNTNAVKMPHGRLLPFAAGLNAMRPDLTIFGVGGDGDAFAIGAAHMINFPGWGLNITYLVANNRVYGLTKGQTAPGSPRGMVTKGTPYGAPRYPLNFARIAVSCGWTFIGRIAVCGKTKDGFDTKRQAVEVMKKALVHRGPSIIIDESECPTYNKEMTPEYLREHVMPVEALGAHDPTDENAAYRLAGLEEKEGNIIPTGVYYHIERETFHERLDIIEPLLIAGRNREEAEKLLTMFA